MKQWEIIADNLSKAGWRYGYVSALDRKRRTIWIVDAHGYGKRFVVRADEVLTAFWNWNGRFALWGMAPKSQHSEPCQLAVFSGKLPLWSQKSIARCSLILVRRPKEPLRFHP